MVISTGITLPRIDSVWALYALQNSMMFTPCGPRAVPTGGAGVAAPAWSCTLTSAAIFFLGGMLLLFLSRGHDEEYVVRLCHLLSPAGNLSIVLRPTRYAKSRSSGSRDASPARASHGRAERSSISARASERPERAPSAQTRWIWLNESSTGVSRPKISTRALTRCDSALISVIV